MWKGERKQGKVWLKRSKQAFNCFQHERKIHAMCSKLMLMCIEVSQLSFSQVNFWFKEINTCMYSTVALRNFKKKVYNRKRTENDSLSLSECC